MGQKNTLKMQRRSLAYSHLPGTPMFECLRLEDNCRSETSQGYKMRFGFIFLRP